MLKEFETLRQEPRSYRRLFLSQGYELYVWYQDDSRKELTGFQIVYFEGDDQKAFTWQPSVGAYSMTVDGWDSNRFNKTPILVEDGTANFPFLLSEMERELEGVEGEISRLVKMVLRKEIR